LKVTFWRESELNARVSELAETMDQVIPSGSEDQSTDG
jgi:hypothetical protein